jgi:hypothetical protein
MPERNGDRWKLNREKILMFSGLLVFFFEVVAVTLFNLPFRIEFLLAAMALCGVSITQWGDKK